MGLGNRLVHAWNAFMNKDPTFIKGPSYSLRPDRVKSRRSLEKTIVSSIYTRISLDCAAIDIMHVMLDDNKRFIKEIEDGLNGCLTLSANLDQTGRALRQDAVYSMLDEGCIAIVPVEMDLNPANTTTFEITSLRVGKIVEWFAEDIRVRLYNEKTAEFEEIILPKRYCAIVENPFYPVMNEPNSTLQRLIRKLNLLDSVDEQSSAGKLDLIIQLPYVIKTEARRQQAENRRKDIEQQLAGSKYGIAYTDGTEHITQLNRSLENNLLKQIEFLTAEVYTQIGLTAEIMNGTADEKAMNNYYNRVIEPIMSAITDEMKRKFLTQWARSRKHSIAFFRDPFKLVATSELAELADKVTRNEIMTSNEFRQVVGLKPSGDPRADQLRNANISESKNAQQFDVDGQPLQDEPIEEQVEEQPETY